MLETTAHPLLAYVLPGNNSLYFLEHQPNSSLHSSANDSDFVDPDYPCISITNETHVLISHKIYLYASLTFVTVGLIGNMLSVMVFSSKEMRPISSNFYLLMLALSDSMYLISVFLNRIMTTLRCLYFKDTEADIVNRNTIICKLLQFLLDLFADYSTCLILAFTIERYIACYLPVQFKDICTLRRAQIVCMSILGVIAAAIAPYHFMHMGLHDAFDICIILLDYETIFSILYVVEALVFRVIPVVVIAVLNVFIIIKVSKVNREKKRRKAQVKSVNNKKKKMNKQDKSMQLTIMLILVSSTYILVYIPELVMFVLWKLSRSHLINMSRAATDITHNYTKILYISGFAINFFLYTMSGRIFREQLELILCESIKKAKRDSYASTAETTTLV